MKRNYTILISFFMCCITGFVSGKNTTYTSPSSIMKLDAATATLSTDPINGSCGTILNFDGVNDYIDISSLANDMSGVTDFTISGWVNTTGNDVGALFAVNNSSGGNTLIVQLDAGKLLLVDEDSVVLKADMSTETYNDGLWHFIAYSVQGTTGSLSVDGTLKHTLTVNHTFSSTNKWSLGQEFDAKDQSDFYNGKLDECSIWNTNLSIIQIQSIQLSGTVGNEANLVAYYDFNDGEGSSSLKDKSTNQNDGSLVDMDSNTDWTLPDGSAGGNKFLASLESINQGDSILLGSSYQKVSGIYYDTLSLISGCDSVIETTLAVILPPEPCNTILNFDGTNDFVEITDASDFNLGNDFTLAARVKVNAGGFQRVFSKRSASNGYGFGFKDNELIFTTFGVKDYITTGVNVVSGIWYDLVVVFNSNNDVEFYLNGALVETVTGTSPANMVTSSAFIGSSDGNGFFNGAVDELAIFNTSLTSIEVSTLFDTPLNDGTAGLLSYYDFNNGQGFDVVTDRLVNGKDGELINMDPETDWTLTDGSAGGNILTSAFINIAAGDSVLLGGIYRKERGNYLDTLSRVVTGCDSIIETGLRVDPPVEMCNTALNFDGGNQYVQIGDATDLIMTNGFTLAARVKSNVGGFQRVFSTRDGTNGYGLGFTQDEIVFTTFGVKDYASGIDVVSGAWYDIVVVFTAANDAEFYVDGVLTATVTGTAPANTATTSAFIGSATASGGFLNGAIDRLAIFNTTLSGAEVSTLFSSTLDNTTPGLISYFDFNDGETSMVLTDNINSLQNGTLINMDPATDWTLTDGSPDPRTFSNVTDSGCESFDFNGQTFTSTGIYEVIIPNAAGCDSIITLDLTIDTPVPSNNVSSVGPTISTDAGATSYQWIDCSDNSVLGGETANTFTATVTGNYGVIASNGSCLDTSVCEMVVITGTEDVFANQGLRIVPNPTSDQVSIVFPNSNQEELTVSIITLDGKELFSTHSSATISEKFDLSSYQNGIYMVKVNTNDKNAVYRIIKN